MKCKIPRSYVFSDQAFDYLRSFGFAVSAEDHLEKGFRRGSISLIDAQNLPAELEFIEILDEDLFFKFREDSPNEGDDRRKLIPSLVEKDLPTLQGQTPHPNGIYRLAGLVNSAQMNNQPWESYMTLSKHSGLVAVILECGDLNQVKSFNSFHREFIYQSSPYGLIHLGPNSFDILIRNSL